MKPSRIEALSDAVFAIVMTLLVLELRVPMIEHTLWESLVALWPKMLSFLITFLILGIFWSSHHIQFTYVKRSNFNYMWLNIIFLMMISLVPFSTALLGEYPLEQLAQAVYSLNLIICAILLYSGWYYARSRDLVEQERISTALIRNARHKMLLPAFLYLLGILISLINVKIALVFFALGPITYFIPVDSRLWDIITGPGPITRE